MTLKELLVNEIYPARQGEGVNIGRPSIFLRTQFCPVHCVWCDTQYTWALNKQKAMSDEAILAELNKYKPVKHIVFTGGEPLANAQREALVRVVGLLLENDFTIEFETSGTFKPFSVEDIRPHTSVGDFIITESIQFNVSPKPPSAQTKLPTDPEAIQSFLRDWEGRSWFKFVAMDEGDFKWIQERVKEWGIPEDLVILMPEGIDRATQEQRLRWVLETVDNYLPLALVTPRMHTMAFGLQRRR